ncbi:MAG: 2-C-methyl-D-erythritol 2,4-cyclodiphosphate synthase, partial [Nitrospiria bacterium]
LSGRPDVINIKGTTHEKLGFIGHGEGIAAQAVCLIQPFEIKNVSND